MVGYLALFIWPFIVMLLFRKREPIEALAWAIIGGYLLLPTKIGINLPILPAINKGAVTNLSALFFIAAALRTQMARPAIAGISSAPQMNLDHVLPGWLPRSKLILFLLALFFVGIFGTVFTNQDMRIYGIKVMQPLRIYDALSMSMIGMMSLIPLMLGRKFLGHPDAQATFLKVLCFAGILYSIPALYEARMSPQLNRLVYGFTAQNWLQGARGGGWRPTVFLPHGLLLSIFFVMSTIAAVTAAKVLKPSRAKLFACAGWLFATVILCNSLGGLMIAILLVPIVLFLGARIQMLICAAIAAIVLTYPLLRATDTVPVDKVVEFARGIDQQRAGSLGFRILNEDILLDRASERPIFGWGGWSRSRVFNERGQDISVTDGIWVIYLGVGGWVGYISQFGLLTLPMILLAFRRRGDPVSLATAGIAMILTANLIDMIPNSSATLLSSLLGGALIGRMEFSKITNEEKPQVEDVPQTASPYTRMPNSHNRPGPVLTRTGTRA